MSVVENGVESALRAPIDRRQAAKWIGGFALSAMVDGPDIALSSGAQEGGESSHAIPPKTGVYIETKSEVDPIFGALADLCEVIDAIEAGEIVPPSRTAEVVGGVLDALGTKPEAEDLGRVKLAKDVKVKAEILKLGGSDFRVTHCVTVGENNDSMSMVFSPLGDDGSTIGIQTDSLEESGYARANLNLTKAWENEHNLEIGEQGARDLDAVVEEALLSSPLDIDKIDLGLWLGAFRDAVEDRIFLCAPSSDLKMIKALRVHEMQEVAEAALMEHLGIANSSEEATEVFDRDGADAFQGILDQLNEEGCEAVAIGGGEYKRSMLDLSTENGTDVFIEELGSYTESGQLSPTYVSIRSTGADSQDGFKINILRSGERGIRYDVLEQFRSRLTPEQGAIFDKEFRSSSLNSDTWLRGSIDGFTGTEAELADAVMGSLPRQEIDDFLIGMRQRFNLDSVNSVEEVSTGESVIETIDRYIDNVGTVLADPLAAAKSGFFGPTFHKLFLGIDAGRAILQRRRNPNITLSSAESEALLFPEVEVTEIVEGERVDSLPESIDIYT